MFGIFNCSSRSRSSTSCSSRSLDGNRSFTARDSSMSRPLVSSSRSLPVLVHLLEESRAMVRQLDDEPDIRLDATVLAVFLDGFDVLADEFEIEHCVPPYGRQVSGFSKELSADVILSCQLSQCPVLCLNADVEQSGVEEGEDDRRDPGSEDEGEGQDLHGYDDVVGMGEVAVRSAPEELSARHDEDSRVPVHPQGEDRPVT